jgi:hypothetical protein
MSSEASTLLGLLADGDRLRTVAALALGSGPATVAEVATAARLDLRPAPNSGRGPDADRILRIFVREGKLVQIPAVHSKRRVVLDWLAGLFEPGRAYPEHEVNERLGAVHPDYAALRRYLVDEEFLHRRDGFYWRAGGTFQV